MCRILFCEISMYTSVSGLVAGFWGGEISGCEADGTISATLDGKNNGAGEVYVGGLSGECFATDTAVYHVENNQVTD